MIISLTIISSGTGFALDTNAFSLATYNKLNALADEQPMEPVTLTSYDVSMGVLSIAYYPASWSGQPEPVDFDMAMHTIDKLLG